MSSTHDGQMSSLGQPPKNHQMDVLPFPLLAAGEEGTSLCPLLQLREVES